MSNFEQLIDLAERLQKSGAVDDSEIVLKAVQGLSDMALGAKRMEILATALDTLANTRGQEALSVLADMARAWGERLHQMAVTSEYVWNKNEEQRLPSNYVQ